MFNKQRKTDIMIASIRNGVLWAAPVLALALLPACEMEEEQHPVPAAQEVEALYQYTGELSVEMSGNVAVVDVSIDPVQYERGGDLWAKAFPYIFVFSGGTRDAFDQHPGLGGVRVRARHPNGDIMSQALLSREVLTQLTWNRALRVATAAQREGTERPAAMRDLVDWGEDHTEFEYNPDYIGSTDG